MSAEYQPDGYHTVTPYLPVSDVEGVIAFMEQVLDAERILQIDRPDGTIQHAEFRIGDSIVMVGEPAGEGSSMPAMLYVYVSDPDATYQSAIRSGATSIMEPADQDYGDRAAAVEDVAGNQWWIARSLGT